MPNQKLIEIHAGPLNSWGSPVEVYSVLGENAGCKISVANSMAGGNVRLQVRHTSDNQSLDWYEYADNDFIKAQSVSMLLLLAFVYTHAPLRICNSYLVDDQQRLGIGFAFVAIGLALIWIVQAFTWSVTATLKGLNHDIPSLGQ